MTDTPDTIDPMPYDNADTDEWTELAYDALMKGELHVELRKVKNVISSHVHGPCPRCIHKIDDEQTHSAVTSLLTTKRGVKASNAGNGNSDDGRYYAFFVTCCCGKTHPHAPTETTGCGASFTVEALLQELDGKP
jgi:hypothetical protein